MTIGNIYRSNTRHPDFSLTEQFNSFLEYLNASFDEFNLDNSDLLIAGDFNIDVLKYGTCKQTATYVDSLFACGLLQLVTKPSRYTPKTASCIDHFVTNLIQTTYNVTALLTPISDHFPIIFTIPTRQYKPQFKTVLSRDFSNDNIKLFNRLLSNLSWNDVTCHNDPNKALDVFYDHYFSLYNNIFQQRSAKFNKNIHKKEKFMTSGLLVSRRTKNKLFKRSIYDPSSFNINTFKAYRNMYNSLVRLSKKLYFHQELENNKSNLRKTWQILNEAISSKKSPQKISSIKINNVLVSDPVKIANHFNSYFTSIASKISEEINPSPDEFITTYTLNHQCFNMSSFNVQQAELCEAVSNLQDKHSLDLNSISMNMVKKTYKSIEIPLLHIFSRSISLGTVPTKFKLAKVVPVFKNGDPSDVSNYRPISLLSNFSKILEKIVSNRLEKYLANNNIITDCQFGFRKKHATVHPMSLLLNKASIALNNKKDML